MNASRRRAGLAGPALPSSARAIDDGSGVVWEADLTMGRRTSSLAAAARTGFRACFPYFQMASDILPGLKA